MYTIKVEVSRGGNKDLPLMILLSSQVVVIHAHLSFCPPHDNKYLRTHVYISFQVRITAEGKLDAYGCHCIYICVFLSFSW